MKYSDASRTSPVVISELVWRSGGQSHYYSCLPVNQINQVTQRLEVGCGRNLVVSGQRGSGTELGGGVGTAADTVAKSYPPLQAVETNAVLLSSALTKCILVL